MSLICKVVVLSKQSMCCEMLYRILCISERAATRYISRALKS